MSTQHGDAERLGIDAVAVVEKKDRSGKASRPTGDTLYRFAALIAALAVLATAGLF